MRYEWGATGSYRIMSCHVFSLHHLTPPLSIPTEQRGAMQHLSDAACGSVVVRHVDGISHTGCAYNFSCAKEKLSR